MHVFCSKRDLLARSPYKFDFNRRRYINIISPGTPCMCIYTVVEYMLSMRWWEGGAGRTFKFVRGRSTVALQYIIYVAAGCTKFPSYYSRNILLYFRIAGIACRLFAYIILCTDGNERRWRRVKNICAADALCGIRRDGDDGETGTRGKFARKTFGERKPDK